MPAGDCAVIAAPSESSVDFRRSGKIDIAVSRLPYHEDFPGAPQNTVADGPALWAAAGKKPHEYKAVARFIAFWLQPENQVAWQRETGYLPLNRAGILRRAANCSAMTSITSASRSSSSDEQARDGRRAKPVVERERVRRILDEELAGVWADSKAAKEALDNAVARASIGN